MTKTQDIRDAVELELSYDPLVDISGITVKNINGEVALNGTVPSFPQYREAAAAARRVAGVKNVHNHLEVVLPSGDYRDDATLTTAANNALMGAATYELDSSHVPMLSQPDRVLDVIRAAAAGV